MSAEEFDRRAAPFVAAIGEAVIAAAALEKVLLADLGTRRLLDQDTYAMLAEDLSVLEGKPAGRLLRNLKKLGLSEDMALRTDDVIQRRNDLIHRPLESYGAAAAITTGKGMDAVVRQVGSISEDCDKLAREILPTTYPAIEQVSGKSYDAAQRDADEPRPSSK